MIVGYDGGTGVPQPVGYISVKFQLWLVSSQWWLVISVKLYRTKTATIYPKNSTLIRLKINITPKQHQLVDRELPDCRCTDLQPDCPTSVKHKYTKVSSMGGSPRHHGFQY
jgi:hypothetical protein